jgi:hypothetical protein
MACIPKSFRRYGTRECPLDPPSMTSSSEQTRTEPERFRIYLLNACGIPGNTWTFVGTLLDSIDRLVLVINQLERAFGTWNSPSLSKQFHEQPTLVPQGIRPRNLKPRRRQLRSFLTRYIARIQKIS